MATKKRIKPGSVNFENDHLLFEIARKSFAYQKLLSLIKASKKIFILGNGGLMDVSSHGAADLSRLVPGKSFRAFNDAGFITSNANDFGFESIFTKWLETTVHGIEDPKKTLILGLSCSGTSSNVINALHWASNFKYNTFFITGAIPPIKPGKQIHTLMFDCKYFHTTEVLVMKLFYDIVHKMGNHCPTIATEVERKSKKK